MSKPTKSELCLELEKNLKASDLIDRKDWIPLPTIESNNLAHETPLPIKMLTFWGSNNNKTKLQTELRKNIAHRTQELLPMVVVLSGIGMDGKTAIERWISFKEGIVSQNSILDINIEEADARLMIHIKDAARNGMKRAVVVSNDTDVLVLCIHYWIDFCEDGLED